MSIKQKLSDIYWLGLRTFLYNDLLEYLFFSKGYAKEINDTIILVPFKYSWFYPKTYEADKTIFIHNHSKPGDTVIDIGAHLGIFSFFLARQVGINGKVYSFEPTQKTFNALTQTIKYNKLNKIIDARQVAVSDTSGELEFYIYSNSSISNGNSISSHNTVGTPRKTTVGKICLDDLMVTEKIERLTLIKIDAEGAELDILKGGKKLITKFHPFITLEVHPKSFDDPQKIMNEIYATIIDYGYTIIMNNNTLTLEEFCLNKTFFEVLLIPNK